MTVSGMRQALVERYSPTIRGELVADMSDAQVVAIYRSLIDRKDAGIAHTKTPKKQRLHEPVQYEQLRMEGV